MKRKILTMILSVCVCLSSISVSAGEFTENGFETASNFQMEEIAAADYNATQDDALIIDNSNYEIDIQETASGIQEFINDSQMEEDIFVPFEEISTDDSGETTIEESPLEELEVLDNDSTDEIVEEVFTESTEEIFAEEILEQEGETAENILIEVHASDWIKNADGSFSLKKENGSLYTSADGLLNVKTDGRSAGLYYFNPEGKMQTGIVSVGEKTTGFPEPQAASYFFMTADLTGVKDSAPYNSEVGQLQKNYWYWNGNAFSYFNSTTGKKLTIAQYTATISNYVGYIKIHNQYYALNANGVPYTGARTLSNKKSYYFSKTSSIPGQMVRNSWVTEKTSTGTWWRYYLGNGQLKIQGNGKQAVAVKLDSALDASIVKNAYYVLSPGGYLLYKNRTVKCRFGNGVEYNGYADNSGMLVKNKLVSYNGAKYYAGSDYKLVKNKFASYDGKKYYFLGNYKMATWKNTWHIVSADNNRYYYFSSDSSVVKKTGFQRIVVNGTSRGWFYFQANGKHKMNEFYVNSKGTIYYFTASGALKNGYFTYNGKTYYFRPGTEKNAYGYAVSGVIYDTEKRVISYADPSTKVLITGWKYINDNWYYFESNFKAGRNKPMKKDSAWGYLDSQGKWNQSGWKIVKMPDGTENRYYISAENGQLLKNCWKTIDGRNYYFQGDGSICKTVDKLPGISYSYYNVSLNRAKNTMTIYSPDWKTPIRVFPVSVGTSSTPTPTGTYRITSTGTRWTLLMGPSYGQWASHFTGGCFIHSIPYNSPNVYDMYPGYVLNSLGSAQSHGCVRMTVSDVYWIYTHCDGGTIVISDYESTPLGTPKQWNIPGNQTYDPTDWNVPENHLNGPAW